MDATREFLVHLALFSSGERFPILLCGDSFQPVVLPTRYILDECRETRQAATFLRNVRMLKRFYDGARSPKSIWRTASAMAGFRASLRFPVSAVTCGHDVPRKFLGLSGYQRKKKPRHSFQATFNSYLAVVEDFLTWAAYEFIPVATPAGEVRDTVEAAGERIRRAFRSNKVGGRAPRKRYGLTNPDSRNFARSSRREPSETRSNRRCSSATTSSLS